MLRKCGHLTPSQDSERHQRMTIGQSHALPCRVQVSGVEKGWNWLARIQNGYTGEGCALLQRAAGILMMV